MAENTVPRKFGFEGMAIFSFVLYETIALGVNFVCGRRVLPPITDMVSKLAGHRWGRFLVWLWLGYWIDHFMRHDIKKKLKTELTDEIVEELLTN